MGLFTEWLLLMVGALVLFVPLAIYLSYLFNSTAARLEARYQVTFKRNANNNYDVKVLRNLQHITAVPQLRSDLEILLRYIDRRRKVLNMLVGVLIVITLVEVGRAVWALISKS